jgi:hypothetical protein
MFEVHLPCSIAHAPQWTWNRSLWPRRVLGGNSLGPATLAHATLLCACDIQWAGRHHQKYAMLKASAAGRRGFTIIRKRTSTQPQSCLAYLWPLVQWAISLLSSITIAQAYDEAGRTARAQLRSTPVRDQSVETKSSL